MKSKFIYSLFFVAVLFSACSTDLDVLGKYKETLVVYGLLDQSQRRQYIKINKAFLGEGNAFSYAQIKDSTQFTHSLLVKIKRMSDGAEFILTPDNSISKDPALNPNGPATISNFYAPDQTNVIYSFATPIIATPNLATADISDSTYVNTVLTTSSAYQLSIKNNETGTEVTGQTSLISDNGSFISPPMSGAQYPVFSFIVPSNDNALFSIMWTSGKNARIYQTMLRFHYIDSTATGNDTLHLDWVFPTQTSQGLVGGESMMEQFKGESFLQFIGSQLAGKPLPTYARRALNTDIIIISGGDDLNTFIQVNAPSTGIVQEKPKYTNINNGLGIFSAKYNRPPYSRRLSSANGGTWDSLTCGRYTKNLKFEDKYGNIIICP